MLVYTAPDNNLMAKLVYNGLKEQGVESKSRNGRVLKFPCPVSMVYTNPTSRCNFTKGRDANPIFHHMESMWMLAGRDDVDFLSMFNSNIDQYSDDGKKFNAAYGYRARRLWRDQLQTAIEVLDINNNSRQAVVQLWDPLDLDYTTKDKACNMSMTFSIDHLNKVNVIIYNRSNDAVYGGVTGANPVHFSYFLQYVAERLGLMVGCMTFVSNNLHVYLDLYPHWGRMDFDTVTGVNSSAPRIGRIVDIERFCEIALDQEVMPIRFDSPTLTRTTIPMYNFWVTRKQGGSFAEQVKWVDKIKELDWSLAVRAWMHNRDNT